MSIPKVSVVMAVYNSQKFLGDAVESILNQSFEDFEFIIVDDGSTDDSHKILNRYIDKRVRIVRQKNEGAASARNKAIEISRADIIAVLDSDDIAKKKRLEKQYRFLKNNTDVIAVGSYAEAISEDGEYVFTMQKPTDPKTIRKNLPEMPFIHPSVMFRKKAFFQAGGYPVSFPPMEDRLLFVRMSKFGDYANISSKLIKYRIAKNSISRTNKRFKNYLDHLINKEFNQGDITKKDLKKIKRLKENDTKEERELAYNLFLGKKYLWNNFKPISSRFHLKKALKNRTNILDIKQILVLFLMTYLNENIVKMAYSFFKKILGK